MENLINIAFREIRQAYHTAVIGWASNDKGEVVRQLKEAIKKTTDLINLLEEKNEP